MNEIIERIVRENTIKYGEIQKCCGLHKHWCRCGVETEVTKYLKDIKKIK